VTQNEANAPRPEPDDDAPIDPLGSTSVLIARAQGGDERAKDRLAARYRTALIRWAHGRLPASARDLVDTDDVVQSALVRGLSKIGGFENRGDGAFLAYIRQALLNEIRDQARRVKRRPEHATIDDRIPDGEASPLERVIQAERLERYEQSLATLSPTRREALILRLELGFRYREIAEAMGLPSGNAARLLASRAYIELSRSLKERT